MACCRPSERRTGMAGTADSRACSREQFNLRTGALQTEEVATASSRARRQTAAKKETATVKATATAVYQRQHKRGLTLPQQSAIDLLASGKTDRETAELLHLSRTTVTKWRLYDPCF